MTEFIFWADVALSLLALPVLAASIYLALLTICGNQMRSRGDTSTRYRFDVIIPAHNEEAGIATTVASVFNVKYPGNLYRVVVVADNCTDATATRAASAGAHVIVRNDAGRKSKGYALAYAFDRTLEHGFAEVVLVVDADTTVSPNVLSECGRLVHDGAAAVQVEYGVRNSTENWRTRLMTLAFCAFHTVRSLGRERLGLSCGLRGNGMAFTTALLRAVPYRAFSLVEDVEYGIVLARAGIRVRYTAMAQVLGEMCRSGASSKSQRDRWERGRSSLARAVMRPLLREAWNNRDLGLCDIAVDLSIPPLARLVAMIMIGGGVTWLPLMFGVSLLARWFWTGAVVGLVIHVGRAWALSGLGLKGGLALTWVPVYMMWKLMMRVIPREVHGGEWVRTARETKG